MYQSLVKPIAFSMDPETAHNAVCGFLKAAQCFPGAGALLSAFCNFSDPALESEVLGLKFKNPVGLAAGFDKNAELIRLFPKMGFGFVEAGTVTAKAQPGNPKPRMFRLIEDEAVINRLGFNNNGADAVSDRLGKVLSSCKPETPIGLNIGKSKVTDLDKATEDYLYSFERLYPFADYFTVNVSSPNTPGLRQLQHQLPPLLAALQSKNKELALKAAPKPIFVKVAPDLELAELDRICENCTSQGIAGIIATNTTLSREGLSSGTDLKNLEGGLSGKPLMNKSTAILKHIRKTAGKKLALIGVGGILSAEDAYAKIKAGASLVQVYTGWVYRGPSFVSEINKGLVRLLKKDGFKNIQEAVGVDQ